MNKQQTMEFILMQIPGLVVLVWWAAAQKHLIYTEIDDLGDNLKERITSLESLLNLHIQESRMSRESISERVQGQGRRFGSKFKRLEQRVGAVLDFNILLDKVSKIQEKLDE
jgi:hypothetical protein